MHCVERSGIEAARFCTSRCHRLSQRQSPHQLQLGFGLPLRLQLQLLLQFLLRLWLRLPL